jgi:hypothetical protein
MRAVNGQDMDEFDNHWGTKTIATDREIPRESDDSHLMEVYLGQVNLPFLRECLSLIGFHKDC